MMRNIYKGTSGMLASEKELTTISGGGCNKKSKYKRQEKIFEELFWKEYKKTKRENKEKGNIF